MKFNYCIICGEKGARSFCPECHNFYHARCGRIKKGVRICENCASIQVASQPINSHGQAGLCRCGARALINGRCWSCARNPNTPAGD